MNVAQGQSLSSDCGGGGTTIVTSMCGGFAGGFVPGAGVAAAPYMAPPMMAPMAPAYPAPAPYAAPFQAAYAAPAGYNSYQAPTVWSGDHVVSAGQPEWAAEDAAQHALNLANWRIKLLQAKLEQAKLAAKVMNVATPSCNTAVKCSAGGYTPATLSAAPSKTSTELRQMKQEMLSLASSTSSAIQNLASKIGDKKGARHDRHRTYLSSLRELKATTDQQLDAVLKKIDAISH